MVSNPFCIIAVKSLSVQCKPRPKSNRIRAGLGVPGVVIKGVYVEHYDSGFGYGCLLIVIFHDAVVFSFVLVFGFWFLVFGFWLLAFSF